jgi:hypothetical protein
MGKYAIVENGIVINTVLAEADIANQNGWIEIVNEHISTDNSNELHPISIGTLYANGQFTKAPVDESKMLISNWNRIRVQRDIILKNSDVNVLPDRWASMNTETQQAWSTYRQSLRDITKQSDPFNIIWPTPPN